MQDFGEKGRGVVTTRSFVKGEPVIEYRGQLIDKKEARSNEYKYSFDETKGSYMFYFCLQNKQYW